VDELNMITGAVIAAGVRIHRKLGPGLLESVYEVVLARDLVRLGLVMNFGMATMKAGIRRIAN
jgi:hypothetical protein